MKKSILSSLAASFCILAMTAGSVSAETMYIDDTLLVPLRSGEGTGFRIVHKGLKSGTKLEILEKKSSGYAHIRTPSGIEGYLPTRYLTAQPIAKVKLAQANQELSKIKSDFSEVKKQLAELQTKHSSLSKEHSKTTANLSESNKELSNIKSISANALSLDKRNRELRESNEQLRNELELIQTENLRLKDKSDSNMMLIGGGLVTLGVILTLLIPIIRPTKKNDSWA